LFDVRGSLPAECADALRSGEADIGLVPVIELARQPDLLALRGCSIACHGAVRSILLISSKPLDQVRTIAADVGSRTSVAMTQVLFAQRFGRIPRTLPNNPDLSAMLDMADAALIIGDPALRIDPAITSWAGRPVRVYDMGAMWVEHTQFPMVFAVWAVKQSAAAQVQEAPFVESKKFGLAHMTEIVEIESKRLGLEAELVEQYLRRHIGYDLGESESAGMRRFLESAGELGLCPADNPLRFVETPALAESREIA
jgi:chorismate dehydratase